MPIHRLTLRLLVALMTSLSMLHLTLEGSGVACSSTGAEGARGTMAMPGAGSHADHSGPAPSMVHEYSDVAQHDTGHHAPAQERCCESMSSCGVTTMAASVVGHASTPRPASRIPAYSDAMLASVASAPEPPPPKA